MRHLVVLAFALLLGAVLASCATLSEDQCQAGDWRAIGYDDGAQGRPAAYVSNHSQACSEYGVTVDQALYGGGRAEGLRTYCTLANAEREGRSGERYHGVCQGELGAGFARVHGAGQDIYALEAQIDSLESEIDRVIRQLTRAGMTPAQLVRVQRDLTGLRFERQSLQRRLRLAEQRLITTRRNAEIRLAQLGVAA